MKWTNYLKLSKVHGTSLLLLVLPLLAIQANTPVAHVYPIQDQDTAVIELFAIPGPDEIMHYVAKDDLKYTPSLLNDTKNNSLYMTSKDRYVALGIYLADLAYCVSFKQTNNAIKYLDVIDDLGKKLNVFPSNIDDIKSRFADNIGNVDTLKALYAEVYESVMDNLFATSRYGHYTLISAGTFVESVHLAVNSTEMDAHSNDFKRRLGDQSRVAQSLMRMYGKNLDKKTQEQIIAEFGPFAKVFESYGAKSSPVSATKRYDGMVVISPSKEAITTQKYLLELLNELTKLRALWSKNK
jgi:hypothetical protein